MKEYTYIDIAMMQQELCNHSDADDEYCPDCGKNMTEEENKNENF